MKKCLLWGSGLLSLVLFLSLSLWNEHANAASGLRPHAPDHILVKFRRGVSEDSIDKFLRPLQASRQEKLAFIGAYTVRLPQGKPFEESLSRFKRSPLVQYAEPDYEVSAHVTLPNDSSFSSLWGLHNTGKLSGSVADADIDAPEAWGLYQPASTIVVAVIDTGIDYKHPDLAANMWVNSGEIPGNRKDDDKNGLVDDVRGWDFANNDSNPMDDNNHGTHVAGTIAAIPNNGLGVAGVAGQGAVKLMPLKFLRRNGMGYTSNAIKALDYAASKGALISNNSWGGGGYSQALYDAISRYHSLGGLFVAAAGNDGKNTDLSPSYPASYTMDNILSVASMTSADTLSSFSNYGVSTVDLAAPGSNILSTLPGGKYGTFSGTSMATPHVTGVAALLKSQNPGFNGLQLKYALLNTVRTKSAYSGHILTGGVVNAQNVLTPVTP